MIDDIVKRLREPPFGTETSERNIMNAAADEIERLSARLAEVERELELRKNYTDADYVRLHKAHCLTADQLASATTQAERLAAALKLAVPHLDDNFRFLRDIQAHSGNVTKAHDALTSARAALEEKK